MGRRQPTGRLAPDSNRHDGRAVLSHRTPDSKGNGSKLTHDWRGLQPAPIRSACRLRYQLPTPLPGTPTTDTHRTTSGIQTCTIAGHVLLHPMLPRDIHAAGNRTARKTRPGTRTPRQRQPASDDGCTTALRGSHQRRVSTGDYLREDVGEIPPATGLGTRPSEPGCHGTASAGYRRPRGLEADARSDLGRDAAPGARAGRLAFSGRPRRKDGFDTPVLERILRTR